MKFLIQKLKKKKSKEQILARARPFSIILCLYMCIYITCMYIFATNTEYGQTCPAHIWKLNTVTDSLLLLLRKRRRRSKAVLILHTFIHSIIVIFIIIVVRKSVYAWSMYKKTILIITIILFKKRRRRRNIKKTTTLGSYGWFCFGSKSTGESPLSFV